jgi:hypothetical protein
MASSHPDEQFALNFLAENTHFKSSAMLKELVAPLRKNKGQFLGLFLIPIERHLLSYEGALLWIAFLVELVPAPAADLREAFGILASTYDNDHSDKIEVHFMEVEDEVEDED